MAKSKLAEHKLDTRVERLEPGTEVAAGPFTIELIHMTTRFRMRRPWR